MAECYELWYKSQTKEQEYKAQAIALYKDVISYTQKFQATALQEIIAPYQAFATLGLEKLLGKKFILDSQFENEIADLKYDDEISSQKNENEQENSLQESIEEKVEVEVEAESNVYPIFYKKMALSIDADILLLMDNIPNSYIVGGAIRDFLLDKKPRDFDIVTSLKPDELVNHLLQIGYTAKIVGINYPIVIVSLPFEKKVEIATFRDFSPKESTSQFRYHPVNGTVSLNINFATHPYPDSFIRDATINSFYYNPRTQEIFNYIPDAEMDLQSKTLRMIGDPVQRFTEDPLRIIRVLELSHRIGFKLDENIENAIPLCKHMLRFVSSGRLLNQCHKIFYCENVKKLFDTLLKYQIIDVLMPGFDSKTNCPHTISFQPVLNSLFFDIHVYFLMSKPISYPFLFAILLWPAVLHEVKNGKSFESIFDDVLNAQSKIIRILPYMSSSIKNMWQAYLLEKKIISSSICNAKFLNDDVQQLCLNKRFSRYVDYYTTQILTDFTFKRSASALNSQSVFKKSIETIEHAALSTLSNHPNTSYHK
jgi:tRNA nucleotidyltransferase/poly(A) polymerase